MYAIKEIMQVPPLMFISYHMHISQNLWYRVSSTTKYWFHITHESFESVSMRGLLRFSSYCLNWLICVQLDTLLSKLFTLAMQHAWHRPTNIIAVVRAGGEKKRNAKRFCLWNFFVTYEETESWQQCELWSYHI